MEIETTIIKLGGTSYLRVPPVMLKHLQIEDETKEMVIQDEEGKHGKYFSAWVKGEQNGK